MLQVIERVLICLVAVVCVGGCSPGYGILKASNAESTRTILPDHKSKTCDGTADACRISLTVVASVENGCSVLHDAADVHITIEDHINWVVVSKDFIFAPDNGIVFKPSSPPWAEDFALESKSEKKWVIHALYKHQRYPVPFSYTINIQSKDGVLCTPYDPVIYND